MATSGVAIAIPGITPDVDPNELQDTMRMFNSPAEKIPVEQRAAFCGSNDPLSTRFVKEFAIPTECTMPLAILTDTTGNVWFAQTNTGTVAKFDPLTENFTEYYNSFWPETDRTVIWGIDDSEDDSIWFTDGENGALWRFDLNTERYARVPYPAIQDSLPQRIEIRGTQILVNDFTGNKLDILDTLESVSSVSHTSIESPNLESFTSDFVFDDDENIWYTNWSQLEGYLVKFDHSRYIQDLDTPNQDLSILDYIVQYQLPIVLTVPNGITIDNFDRIWISDTGSSGFFSFDPTTEQFTQYVTSTPLEDTYGNKTGVILTPTSRPYWMDTDDQGRIVFNLQSANSIAVLNPTSETLIEYHIPSRNPAWADCDDGTRLFLGNCGIAQVLDFAISGKLIWFTEWVENNIGVIDTSIPLPTTIDLESDTVTLQSDTSATLDISISSESITNVVISSVDPGIQVDVINDIVDDDIDDSISRDLVLDISAAGAEPGAYKILVGAQLDDITVSKFITVTVL